MEGWVCNLYFQIRKIKNTKLEKSESKIVPTGMHSAHETISMRSNVDFSRERNDSVHSEVSLIREEDSDSDPENSPRLMLRSPISKYKTRFSITAGSDSKESPEA